MNEEALIGLIISIVFFIVSAISTFYIWFREGADKLSTATLKFWNNNAPRSVSKFDEMSQHPLLWKTGSVLMLVISLFAIYIHLFQ